VRNVDDILEALAASAPHVGAGVRTTETNDRPEQPTQARTVPPDLDATGQRVWEFLADGPRHADYLAQHLELPVPELMRALMTLEMKKAIRRLPGNQYERW
jgi:DNA processing protein